MNLIYTMNNRIYICNKLRTIIVVLLYLSCESGAMNISDESTTVVLTNSTAYTSPNTTTNNDITTTVVNATTTSTYLTTTTPEEITTAVINTSTTITSYKSTTLKESTAGVIHTTTTTTTPETTTIKEITTTTTTVINNSTTSTSPKTITATSRVPQKHSQKTLFLCQCGSGEVMNHTGQCQPLADGTTVPTGSQQRRSHPRSTTDFNVTINKPKCPYHRVDLQDGQFMLRGRGDLLVFEGDLRGFRVTEYCIHHELVEGRVKVTARGCVPQPVIPHCCPKGEHMDNGECVTNQNIAKPFDPYLGTAPFDNTELPGVPFPWNDHQEQIEKPTCAPGNIIKKFELVGNKTYLAVGPKKVLLTFLSDNGQRQYRFNQYCVDVQDSNGKYHAYSCERDPEWTPEAYCKGRVCTNKCCPDGQALSLATRFCVSNSTTFTPPFTSLPSSLEILYGWPKCGPMTNIGNFQLLQDGTLIHRGYKYTLSKFCIDNFIMGDSVETQGLACTKDIQPTTWHMVRKMLFPVCLVLSCVSLVLLILLHVWIPKLREKEGKYQLFHAASLFFAYSVTLAVQILVPKGYVTGYTCTALAFVMQFAFLSAFFWLNTMCFDVWRLFRNLVRSMYSAHTTVSIWKYVLYALGGPLIITVITIIVQFVAPTDGSVPGLVHPYIGEGRCWFRSGKELLAYFYGPIAVLFFLNFIFIGTTYHYLKIIRGDYKSKNDPSEYTINSRETTRKYDFFSAFWQRFYLLSVVTICWLTEILSWLIPPEEMWAATDILNNLQGVFVFFIFLSHHNKRALLKGKLPKLFKFGDIFINHARTAQTSINNSTKKLSRKISSSTILSNVSSFSSFSTKKFSRNISSSSILSNVSSFSSFSKRSISTSSFSLSKNEPSINTPSTGIRSLSLTRKVSKPLDFNNSPGTLLSEIHQNHI